MLELVSLQKFRDVPEGGWQCTTMLRIGRFQSIFLMTCCPGELSWRHACGFHLLQCANCSHFAVKLPLLFSELLFACTMARLTSTCGVRWRNWPVKYVLYSLLSSLKAELIPLSLECLTFCSVEPASPGAYCLQLPVFSSAEVALAPTSWSILSSKHSVC